MAQCVRGSRIVLLDRMRRKIIDEPAWWRSSAWRRIRFPIGWRSSATRRTAIPACRAGARSRRRRSCRSTRTSRTFPRARASGASNVRGAASLAASLRDHRDEAFLYRRLATLRFDVPLGEQLDDLRWRGAHREELTALCAELDDDGSSSACRAGAARRDLTRLELGRCRKLGSSRTRLTIRNAKVEPSATQPATGLTT